MFNLSSSQWASMRGLEQWEHLFFSGIGAVKTVPAKGSDFALVSVCGSHSIGAPGKCCLARPISVGSIE